MIYLQTFLLLLSRLPSPSISLSSGYGIVPVSYTHLDVYKRQGHTRSVRIFIMDKERYEEKERKEFQ